MASVEVLYSDGFTFQQDNASAHTAKSTKELFSYQGYDFLDWPENLWRLMKDALEKEGERSIELNIFGRKLFESNISSP